MRQHSVMRPKAVLLLAILLAGIVTSVASAQLRVSNSINWRTFRQGAFSNGRRFETQVIETEGLWQRYWGNVVGGKVEDTPDGVDWSKEKLVAINLGQRTNTGYELYVRSVERFRANEIRVNVVERLPIPGMRTAQVMTSPWIVIKMERTPGTVTFNKQVEDGSNRGGFRITQVGPPSGSCCTPPCQCCKSCGCGCQQQGHGGGGHGGG
jgi:hypothetical protein